MKPIRLFYLTMMVTGAAFVTGCDDRPEDGSKRARGEPPSPMVTPESTPGTTPVQN